MIVVNRTRIAKNGDVIVAAHRGELVLKRYQEDPPALLPDSHNPIYQPILITEYDDFEIFGVA